MNSSSEETIKSNRIIGITILVAALGYFVDVYDLILFSVVRIPSLKSLGLTGNDLLEDGIFLLNVQMVGLLIGGMFWGILGDKRGRLSVLFGSITLYSVANIANGFVETVEAYAVWRFLAGVGLAGELGAGITLVSEIMPKETRGYGTTIVATVGVAGAVVAGITAEVFENWRVCYWIGGGMGLALLALRVAMHESGLFNVAAKNKELFRGNFLKLFSNKERFKRYLYSILVGLPIWFIVGILITLAPEFGAAFNLQELPTGTRAIMLGYVGFVIGDLTSGLLCQLIGSRKKVLQIYILMCAASITLYLAFGGISLKGLYAICILMGITGGYWAVFVSSAAEQFGTNLRATVATTVPNFVRASLVPVSALFVALKAPLGIIESAFSVGLLTVLIALYATTQLSECFGKDLDFTEE